MDKADFILTPREVWRVLKDIRVRKKEYFVAFYLGIQNRLIRKEIISIGTLNASLVHPREVFEPAIRNLSAQIILAHNHPSGDAHPSKEDLAITKRMVESSKILGIEVIDHVIVAEETFFSLKEHGLL